MQTWASSKQAPLGQFRGSTGAQIMSASELSAGYQAWAKKVLFLISLKCMPKNYIGSKVYQSLVGQNILNQTTFS